MALDCKKLSEITKKSRGIMLKKVNDWLVHRQQGIAENMVKRAESGFGEAVITIPVPQVIGLSATGDTLGLTISVCVEAVQEFVGGDAKVSARGQYDNIVVVVNWQ